MKFIYILLLGLLLQACNTVETEAELRSDVKTSKRNSSTYEYVVKDYGDQIGIFEINSGEFIYCADCNNQMDLQTDLEFEGVLELNIEGDVIYAYDSANEPLFSIHLDRSKNDISTNRLWETVNSYEVGTIGYSYGNVSQSLLTNSSNNWIPSNLDDFISSLPLCQCVGNSSTPCTNDYEDQTDGCDVGGEGATGCGASSGQGGTATIVGSGGGGQSSSGCSISCGEGMYACCDYEGG